MTGPEPCDLAAVLGLEPDPRLAAWASRLRAAIAEEKPSAGRSTHARVTKVISRDGIRAVIADLEAAAEVVPHGA